MSDNNTLENKLKSQIIEVLQHPEAEEGLYLENFYHLHEEDERPRINASEDQILGILKNLISSGVVEEDNSREAKVFKLITKN